MKTIGIVAEYNPFHNGHKYQIDTVRKITGADNIVVVMSGNFVQRGTPAWTDKYLRTNMALDCGADFVFELPTIYATASAEHFALGAVSLLNSLGFIDGICFGSEYGNISLLDEIADKLIAERDTSSMNISAHLSTYLTSKHISISEYMSQGYSYPAARQFYLQNCMTEHAYKLADILNKPNNILGIEYLKALKTLDSNILPVTLQRCDQGYHSTNIDSCDTRDINHFCSASALRHNYMDSDCSNFVPVQVTKLLNQNKKRFPVTENVFSNMLYYKLLSLTHLSNSSKETVFIDYIDVSPELSARIVNNLHTFNNYSDFIVSLKTKQYTYSRVSRALLHILLDIKQNMCATYTDNRQLTPYARLLGMNKNKSSLLRQINGTTLITKVANANKLLTDKHAIDMFNTDIYASNIYRQGSGHVTSIPDEYRAGIITANITN